MVECFCVRCKKKVQSHDVTLKHTKNGRDMVEGKCPHCGTKCVKFISKEEATKLGNKGSR